MKKIIQWIVLSSQNSDRYSLAFKGMVTTGVTVGLFLVGVFHLSVPAGSLDSLADALQVAFNSLLALISLAATTYAAFATVWGWVRKIYTTIRGTNEVVIDQKLGNI